MPDTVLETLAAERAIRRLVSLYCDAVRRKDVDAAGTLFAADARVQIADFPERVGRAQIVDGLRRTLADFTYLHQICDMGLIDLKGDVARARLGVIEANRPNGSESLNMIFGAYEDEYKLLEEGWRFHRRRFNLQLRALLPTSEIQAFQALAPSFPFAPILP